MAKQAGDIKITGVIDDLCFYKMDGRYYVRMKSSLSSKNFWKHKAFEGSRKSCERFGEGNKLASKLYRMVEKEKRGYTLFCFLKRKAIQLLKEGKSLLAAEEALMDYLGVFGLTSNSNCEVKHHNNYFSESIVMTVGKTDENIQDINLTTKSKPLKMVNTKIYACAVGPPNVIGI
jgi:hypothetical protein